MGRLWVTCSACGSRMRLARAFHYPEVFWMWCGACESLLKVTVTWIHVLQMDKERAATLV